MLNHKYLISAFSTGEHPFQQLFAVVSGLKYTKMVREFSMVDDYDLEPVHLVNDYPLEALLHGPHFNDVVEMELTSVEKDLYTMVVPRLVASATVTSGICSSSLFFTDGSKGETGTGFGVNHSGGPESSFHLREPGGVFTSEMSNIFVAVIQIRARRPGKYLILTDRMSSLKALWTQRVSPRTHSLVYEIKEACGWLKNNGYVIHMIGSRHMWR
jgi:hypothetical protein